MSGVQERLQLLLDDPDISEVEPHRVFCNRCDKWLKLDENKMYAASVWRCHKNTKSHNSKVLNLSASAPPPTKDTDSRVTADKESSASLTLPTSSREKLKGSTPGPSLRPRPSWAPPEKSGRNSVESTPAPATKTIPLLKLKVPARSGSASLSTPLSGGVSAASRSSSASIVVTGPSNKFSSLPTLKPRPTDTETLQTASARTDTPRTDTAPRPMPPPAHFDKRKRVVQLATQSPQSSTTAGVTYSAPNEPFKSSSFSDSTSVLEKEKDPMSTTGSAVQRPFVKGVPPERQASYAALSAEPLIQILEPFRVLCSLCKCWVDLSSRTPYSYGVWKGHVRKSKKHALRQSNPLVNEYDSDHSPNESVPRSIKGNISAVGSNGANGRPTPSTSAPRPKPESATPNATVDKIVNETKPGKAESRDDNLAHVASSSSAQHALKPSITPKVSKNAVKETTAGSVNESFMVDQSGGDLLEGDMPALTESSDDARLEFKSQRKMTPNTALRKRRDDMLADPDAAVVEARRVKCRMCDKWIKGSNTQEYSSHHWLKHKKKCSRGRPRNIEKTTETAEMRKLQLEADPDLDILEPHRALCKLCQKWVKLCNRSRWSASHWFQHKSKCPATQGEGLSTEPGESTGAPVSDEKGHSSQQDAAQMRRNELLNDPDVKYLMSQTLQCRLCSRWITHSSSATVQYSNANWLLHKEHCVNLSPSKMKAALEARKKFLMEDPDVAELERFRARCAVCSSWIKLRSDCSYSLGKWMLHRRRCGQKTRELLGGEQSSHSGDAGIAGTDECYFEDPDCVDHADDSQEAMELDKMLQHDSSGEDGPTGFSGSRNGSSGPAHPADVDEDRDVPMDGVRSTSDAVLDADDEAEGHDKGKGKGVQRPQGSVSSTQKGSDANQNQSTQPKESSDVRQEGDNQPQQSTSGRRSRGKAAARVIRPLPIGRAAPFMRGRSAMILPPLPPRPRWPDEDERKQKFTSDLDVLEIEPYRVRCKHCRCWIRLHPTIKYLQSVWPRHKESCKETLAIAEPVDARSRARLQKEDARQRLLETDPYATDVTPHRVTCKACGTQIRLDTTYKFEGSHWRAHRSRCTSIPLQERLAKKRKLTDQSQIQAPARVTVAVADSSDSDDSDASSAPRPPPTAFFTAPLIIKPTEMFKHRHRTLATSRTAAAAAAVRAENAIKLKAGLEKLAVQLESEGRFLTVLEASGDGDVQAHMEQNTGADDEDAMEVDGAPGPPEKSPMSDPELLAPRKRTREEIEEFDAFFSRRPLPMPAPALPTTGKARTCNLAEDAMKVVD